MKSFILFFLLFSGTASFAQQILPDWILTEKSPVPNAAAESWSVTADTGGILFWTTNLNIYTEKGYDVQVYRVIPKVPTPISGYLANGGIFAQQSYIIRAFDSLLLIGGRTCSSNDINLKSCDGFILVHDLYRDSTLWFATVDRDSNYEETDGALVFDSAIYISGWSKSDTSDIDAFIRSYDKAGNINWTTYYGGKNTDHADGQMVADENFLYISGTYDGVPNPIFIGLSGFDGKSMLAKFSRADGTFIRKAIFGVSDSTYTNFEDALGMTSDGTYLYVTGVTTVAKNDNQIFVAKFDKNLSLKWYKTFGGDSTETARAVAVDSNGNIWVAGQTNSMGAGGYDVLLLGYSPDGKLLYSGTWGGPDNDDARDIIFNRGKLYIAGVTHNDPSGVQSALLMQVTPKKLLDVKPEPSEKNEVALYPNPVRSSALFEISSPQDLAEVTIEISDALGRIVRTLTGSALAPITFERGSLAGGVYLYSVRSLGEILGRGTMIIE
jgi:hypothetical protein